MKIKLHLGILLSLGVFLLSGCSSTQNSKFKEVSEKYKEFYTYENKNGEEFDLRKSDTIIMDSTEIDLILKKSENGKTSRQEFVEAWGKLSSEEKSNDEMKAIQDEYNKIIDILEASKANLEFYNNVIEKSDILIKDKNTVQSINNKENTKSGARGNVVEKYKEAISYDEDYKNSQRIANLREIYFNTTNFLLCIEFIQNDDIDNAKKQLEKITDENFKEIASGYIN